jgi:hypothetical protein
LSANPLRRGLPTAQEARLVQSPIIKREFDDRAIKLTFN